jgi:hypothetical protein
MGLLPVAESHDTNGALAVAFVLEQPSGTAAPAS